MKKNFLFIFLFTLLTFISSAQQDTDFYSHPDWAKNASI
jgi:hypothetical protein